MQVIGLLPEWESAYRIYDEVYNYGLCCIYETRTVSRVLYSTAVVCVLHL